MKSVQVALSPVGAVPVSHVLGRHEAVDGELRPELGRVVVAWVPELVAAFTAARRGAPGSVEKVFC